MKMPARMLAVAGIATALSAVAVPAAMASTQPAFSVSITPTKVHMAPDTSTVITIRDSGTKPIKVIMRGMELGRVTGIHTGWALTNQPARYAHIYPRVFTLQPEQVQAVKVIISSKAAPYHHDLAVVAQAIQPSGIKANGVITAGVASHLVVKGKPWHAPTVNAPAAPKPASGHGMPLLIFGVVSLISLVWSSIAISRSWRRARKVISQS